MSHSTRKLSLLLLGITLICGSSSRPLADHHEEPSKANMPKERAAFYQSDQWKKVLHPELKQKVCWFNVNWRVGVLS